MWSAIRKVSYPEPLPWRPQQGPQNESSGTSTSRSGTGEARPSLTALSGQHILALSNDPPAHAERCSRRCPAALTPQRPERNTTCAGIRVAVYRTKDSVRRRILTADAPAVRPAVGGRGYSPLWRMQTGTSSQRDGGSRIRELARYSDHPGPGFSSLTVRRCAARCRTGTGCYDLEGRGPRSTVTERGPTVTLSPEWRRREVAVVRGS